MDLPDCPPGAEGYEDTVTQVPAQKPVTEDPSSSSCTKVRIHFVIYIFN